MFEQDRVLVRLQQIILKDEQILACFLAGSHGRGTQDKYSDIDLILIFADHDSRELAFKERGNFVKSVLPYLKAKSFDAEHVNPFLHIALYGNGAKVDLSFETVEFEPKFELLDMRILKDSDGWAAAFLRECAARSPVIKKQTAGTQTLADVDHRFWIMFLDIYRRLLRDDHDSPFPIYLQMIYFTIPNLLDLLAPEDPAYQALIELRYSPDTLITIKDMKRLMGAYLDARAAVVKRHNLYFPVDTYLEADLLKKLDFG